jgi:hypothetical protein
MQKQVLNYTHRGSNVRPAFACDVAEHPSLVLSRNCVRRRTSQRHQRFWTRALTDGDDNTQILLAVALMLVADARAWMPLSGAALPAMAAPIRARHESACPRIIMQARLRVLCVHCNCSLLCACRSAYPC